MKPLRILAVLALIGTLTACETVPTDPSVLAGPERVSAGRAAGLFEGVCKRNQMDLSNAVRQISALPFTLNTSQDIYYHNDLNLSFKLTKTPEGSMICSMVWLGIDPPAVNEAAILSIASDASFRVADNGLMSTAIVGFQ